MKIIIGIFYTMILNNCKWEINRCENWCSVYQTTTIDKVINSLCLLWLPMMPILFLPLSECFCAIQFYDTHVAPSFIILLHLFHKKNMNLLCINSSLWLRIKIISYNFMTNNDKGFRSSIMRHFHIWYAHYFFFHLFL